MTRVRLDDVLGRSVRDRDGRDVGRVYEILAEHDGDDLVVMEYHLGTGAMLQRLGLSLLTLVGVRRAPRPIKVPWDRMDVRDPFRPVFLGTRDELR